MKRLFSVILTYGFINTLLISCVSWKSYDLNENNSATLGIHNANYETSIKHGSDYLKAIQKQKQFPSISIAVGHQGKVIWSEAVGYADIDTKIQATTKTKYRIGSTSKALTSTGVALLVDRELLNLKDTIVHIIPHFPVKKWNFTSEQLLSHTAGIVDYKNLGLSGLYYTLCNCKQFNSVSESLKVFNRRKLQYQPGTKFYYNSFDFVLMSSVIEVKSNVSFLSFMQSEIFDELEMTSTVADHSVKQIDDIATFYKIKPNKYKKYKTFGVIKDVNLSYKWAGGGFLSTPEDLVKLGNAYVSGNFLSEKVKSTFFTPQVLTNGEVNHQKYALGWRSYKSYKIKEFFKGEKPIWIVHHGGISKGSMAFLILFPDYDLVIAATINTVMEDFWNDFAKDVFVIANYFLETIAKD